MPFPGQMPNTFLPKHHLSRSRLSSDPAFTQVPLRCPFSSLLFALFIFCGPGPALSLANPTFLLPHAHPSHLLPPPTSTHFYPASPALTSPVPPLPAPASAPSCPAPTSCPAPAPPHSPRPTVSTGRLRIQQSSRRPAFRRQHVPALRGDPSAERDGRRGTQDRGWQRPASLLGSRPRP